MEPPVAVMQAVQCDATAVSRQAQLVAGLGVLVSAVAFDAEAGTG